MTPTLEIQVLALDKHTNVARLNRLMGLQTPSLSDKKTKYADINKQ
jgi:hypothetical protein